MQLGRRIAQYQFDWIGYQTVYRHLNRSQILLACMPKSGSTFLSNVIGALPEFRKKTLSPASGREAQNLSSRLALRRARHNYVSQHHVKYNANTAEIIETFGVTPVVLVRNIFDCVPSIRDHLRREAVEAPIAFFQKRHPELDDAELENMIVRLAIPWYIDFYVSWMHCHAAMLVTYEALIDAPVRTIHKVLRHAGHETSERKIELALDAANLNAARLNVGKSGRGRTLSEKNKAIIRRYCTFYPDVDFSPIGID